MPKTQRLGSAATRMTSEHDEHRHLSLTDNFAVDSKDEKKRSPELCNNMRGWRLAQGFMALAEFHGKQARKRKQHASSESPSFPHLTQTGVSNSFRSDAVRIRTLP